MSNLDDPRIVIPAIKSEEWFMNLPLTLTMEQQFNLRMYEGQVKDLSPEQAQDTLLEVMRQLMIKDNVIRHLMKGSL